MLGEESRKTYRLMCDRLSAVDAAMKTDAGFRGRLCEGVTGSRTRLVELDGRRDGSDLYRATEALEVTGRESGCATHAVSLVNSVIAINDHSEGTLGYGAISEAVSDMIALKLGLSIIVRKGQALKGYGLIEQIDEGARAWFVVSWHGLAALGTMTEEAFSEMVAERLRLGSRMISVSRFAVAA